MAPRKRRNLDAGAAEIPGQPGISSGPSMTKKIKFNTEDPVDEEEYVSPSLLHNAILTSRQHRLEVPNQSSSRRNAVKDEGYGSDSSDEDMGGEAGPTTAAMADEDDMFNTTAPVNKEEPAKGPIDGLLTKASAKGKAFLDIDDIEGQETGKTHSGRLDSEDEDTEEEVEEDFEEGDEHANDDDAPRSRRSKKSMGYVISSFNMKDELQEGKITADGSYLANAKDPLAVHDNWLNGVSSRKELKKAKEAKERADARAREQERADARALPRVDSLKAIAESGLVRRHESCLAALARHGQAKKAGDTEAKKRINDLTTLVSGLFDIHGENDIYEETCDDIVRTLRLEGEVPRGWEPDHPEARGEASMEVDEVAPTAKRRGGGLIARPSAPVNAANDRPRFSYRWAPNSGAPADQLDAIHGPFTYAQMSGWIGAAYFGPRAERIEVRVDGSEAWMSWNAASVQ